MKDNTNNYDSMDVYKGKVLVVDDMLLHLDTAKLYLERAGYKVFCASDIKGALKLLREEEPELVLLDIVMPGGNGLNLLLKIRSLYPDTGVVIVTAYGSEDIAASALKLGAIDYIRKPFKYRDLISSVEKFITKLREMKNKEIAIEALKQNYENLQVSADSILQCMSAGVVAVDGLLCIRMINQRMMQLFNINIKNTVGRPFYEVFPMFKNTGLLKYTYESGRAIRQYEVEIPETNGVRFLNINTDVIFDLNSNKIGAVVVFDDITERKKAELQLVEERVRAERTERLASLGRMAAGIAHEINQPLNSLKIVVDGILYLHRTGHRFELEEIIEELKKITAQADRIDNSIKRLRSFVRREPDLELTPCNLNDAVEGALSMVGSQLSSHGVTVKKSLQDEIYMVLAENSRLEEMIINLVINAMQALDKVDKPDKEIEITTFVKNYKVILEVSDNAIGINKSFKDKIFEPFFTTKEVGEGMGLGLSIVHSIVNSYKGQIYVKTNNEGGATFRVEFPICTS
ncbi:response regulator [Desulfolucanica intricata]|uniref:response regulator n=1 Tax=Desulfolucanica intricata TaxID=1285191 RepID=UPI0008353FB2|nr:response regulator [Desulfolucanica intricata]